MCPNPDRSIDYPCEEYDDGADFDEMSDLAFECAAYWDGEHWFCPLIGSEDCDWECPEGGIRNVRKTSGGANG